MSEKVTQKPTSKQSAEQAEHMVVYHAPVDLNEADSPSEQLNAILAHLKLKQQWLAKQPAEAILGLFDTARKTWAETPELDPYRHTGT